MRYKKTYPKTSSKTVDVLAVDGAINCGCYMQSGKLVPAISSAVTLKYYAQKPTIAWYAGGPKKHILFTENRIYYTSGGLSAGTYVNINAKNPSVVETVSNATPVVYVIGDSSYLCIGSAQTTAKPFKGGVHSCVLKNGRIFGIDNSDPYKIKWSGEGGIDDWVEGISGAGWTVVQHGYGEILNLIVYRDKLVAVRKNGLTFLSAHGTPENFKLSYLETRLPEIHKNTAAVVGTCLAFYTQDGLYLYDGIKVEKCSLGLAEDIQSPTMACGAKGKYFLCGISKSVSNKVVFVFDAMRNVAYLIRVTANAVSAGENIYAYTDICEYRLEEGGRYDFTSGQLDFSSRGEKVLKEVIFDGAENVKLEVSNGVDWNIVEGVRGKYRPNMRGKSFIIKLYAKGKLNGISAVAEVKDGV